MGEERLQLEKKKEEREERLIAFNERTINLNEKKLKVKKRKERHW